MPKHLVVMVCTCCGQRFCGAPECDTVDEAREQVRASAQSYGWIDAGGFNICSDSCAADKAKDITPVTELEAMRATLSDMADQATAQLTSPLKSVTHDETIIASETR